MEGIEGGVREEEGEGAELATSPIITRSAGPLLGPKLLVSNLCLFKLCHDPRSFHKDDIYDAAKPAEVHSSWNFNIQSVKLLNMKSVLETLCYHVLDSSLLLIHMFTFNNMSSCNGNTKVKYTVTCQEWNGGVYGKTILISGKGARCNIACLTHRRAASSIVIL